MLVWKSGKEIEKGKEKEKRGQSSSSPAYPFPSSFSPRGPRLAQPPPDPSPSALSSLSFSLCQPGPARHLLPPSPFLPRRAPAARESQRAPAPGRTPRPFRRPTNRGTRIPGNPNPKPHGAVEPLAPLPIALPHRTSCSAADPLLRCTSAPAKGRSSSASPLGSCPRPLLRPPSPARAGIETEATTGETLHSRDSSPPVIPRLP
jgi:hypothetical protein